MNKDKKQEKDICNCQNTSEECICGENCTCDEDCTCNEECLCGDNCTCEDECTCCEEECSCEDSYNEEVIKLSKEVNDLKEALLRNQADLQNYKRRKDEETERLQKYKNEELIKELLTVVDNFERPIKMDDNDLSDEVSKFLSGFKLIYTNTVNILNKYEVKEIKAEGIEFDPTYHHAVLTEQDDTKPAGVVLEVLQKGYMYKDRVIRPAMVKVNE